MRAGWVVVFPEGSGREEQVLLLPLSPELGCVFSFRKNDPTAGSPTVTLLRLLLPLLK